MTPAATPAGDRLLSVWTGDDYLLLPRLIKYYCRRSNPLILDATYGDGRFWRLQGDLNVIGIDIEKKATVRGDNRHLPFKARSFDVVVYDPPHLTDQATSTGREKFIHRYGDAGNGPNCVYLFPPFLDEAARVLKFPGLLICKMIDTVNRRKQELQHIDFILMARDHGFTVDDLKQHPECKTCESRADMERSYDKGKLHPICLKPSCHRKWQNEARENLAVEFENLVNGTVSSRALILAVMTIHCSADRLAEYLGVPEYETDDHDYQAKIKYYNERVSEVIDGLSDKEILKVMLLESLSLRVSYRMDIHDRAVKELLQADIPDVVRP